MPMYRVCRAFGRLSIKENAGVLPPIASASWRNQATCHLRLGVGGIVLLAASGSACGDGGPAPWDELADASRTAVVRLLLPDAAVRAAGPFAADSVLDAADAALAGGMPWRATQILSPLVDDPGRRTPRAVLLAATAAAEWRGWDEVLRLLRGEAWLESAFAGAGNALVARAALEAGRRDLDSVALVHARRAVIAAPTTSELASRLVTMAPAFERVGMRDSARLAYERAAREAPVIADWLLLRAAGHADRQPDRAAAFGRIEHPAARARVPWVDAAARERERDITGAARLLDSLGDRVGALRVRLTSVGTDAARLAIRRELRQLIDARRGTFAGRQAALLLDGAFAPLGAREELAVARNDAVTGPAPRAAAGFAAAFREGVGSTEDRYTYGTVLARLGRHDEAIVQFAHAARSPALSARARYQRGRSLLRSGRLAASRAELRAVVRSPGLDGASAARALYLLADLATDERRDPAARAAFLELARRYPTSPVAPSAAFRAAIIALAHDSVARAAGEFDAIATRYPRSGEATAAVYWAGRAWARLGDPSVSRARWLAVIQRDPRSYYAVRAARRIGAAPWTVPPGSVRRSAAVDSAMNRAALLERVGLEVEARREYDWLERAARTSPSLMVTTAAAFRDNGMGARAIRLATDAIGRGVPRDRDVYRLLYPMSYEDVIAAESRAHGVDRALVMALIRQESSFSARATSPAGARGLMQVMPAVGRRSAVARRARTWSDALLYQPDVNVQLGTAHLATVLDEYGALEHALAAYNAGGSRVDRWMRKAGATDAELFVERIPYVETRDYVRIVIRNAAMYRTLYASDDAR